MIEPEREQDLVPVQAREAAPEAGEAATRSAVPTAVRAGAHPAGMKAVLRRADAGERRKLVHGMQQTVGNAITTNYLVGPTPGPALMRQPTATLPAAGPNVDDELLTNDPGQSIPDDGQMSSPPPPAPPSSGDDGGAPNQSTDPGGQTTDPGGQTTDPSPGGQSTDPGSGGQSTDPGTGGGPADPGGQSVDPGAGAPNAAGPSPDTGGGGGGGGAPPSGSGDGGAGGAPAGPGNDGAGGAPPGPPGSTQSANAPQAGPMGTGYNRTEYGNQLDSKLTELFNQRADPDAKDKLTKMDTAADTARLASLQYSFNTGSLTSQLIASVLPADAIVEHFRQATTQNAYASSANLDSWSGAIAGVQTGIEFGRGITHILGDVIGAAGTALGAFAVISGGLALIPPLAPAMAPLAAASAAGGEILTLIKAAADIIDTELSIVQVLLGIVRARLSDDPHDRARIAMQLKKEANDISGNLVSIGIQAATIGLGKALGKIPTGAAGQEAAAIGKMTVKEFMQEMAADARPAASAAYKQAMKVAASDAKILGLEAAQLASEARLRGGIPMIMQGLRDSARFGTQKWAVPAVMTGKMLAISAGGTAAGTGIGFTATGGKMANAMSGPAGPGKNNMVPGEIAKPVTTQTVSYWPDILDKFNSTRGWVQNASERMLDQYNLAKADAGDKAKVVGDVYGGVSRFDGGRIMAAGGAQKAKAETGAQTSDKAAAKAKEGQAKGEEAAKKGTEAQAKVAETASKTGEAKNAAEGGKDQATKESSLWDKAKKWAWDHTLGWVFEKLGALQKWLNDQILALALDWAGLSGGDLDLAGIERSALGDKAKDETAKKDAADTQAAGPQVDAAWAQLTEGASSQEKNAMQGMVETMAWIHDLDAWDQLLAGEQEAGAAYIARTAPLLAHEADTQEGGDSIDSAYAAPFLDGATAVEAQASASPETLRNVCTTSLQSKVTELEAAFAPAFAGFDATPAFTTGTKAIDDLMGKATPELELCVADAQRLGGEGAGFIGTTDYAGFAAKASELDAVAKRLQNTQMGVVKAFDTVLQAILDAYVSTAEGLAQPAQATPGDAATPADGSAPAAPAAAPAAPPETPQPGPVAVP